MLGRDGIDATTTCNRRLRFIENRPLITGLSGGELLATPADSPKSQPNYRLPRLPGVASNSPPTAQLASPTSSSEALEFKSPVFMAEKKPEVHTWSWRAFRVIAAIGPTSVSAELTLPDWPKDIRANA